MRGRFASITSPEEIDTPRIPDLRPLVGRDFFVLVKADRVHSARAHGLRCVSGLVFR
ncbi:hypothetical protein CBM2631_B10268 [Cupriavidus taiwanensis]|nr:hypothetical protein CBM2631_B10268 [Cupriavidus taiwanensis]